MKIRFAVVGAGRIGKRHAQEIQNNPHGELVGLCDIRSREECNVEIEVPFFHTIDQLIEEVQPDVVHICSPNITHFPLSRIVLEKGINVVVEKPLALKKENCMELIELSKKRDCKIFTVMQNRYSPPSQWMKEMLDSKILGKIYMVNIDCFWNRNKAYYLNSDWKGDLAKDGGTIFTQFSHFIDIMYWFFGDIKNIQSKFHNNNHQTETNFEDSGISTFEFLEGGMGSFTFSTSVFEKNFESSMTIIAEKGTVKIGGQYMNEVEYCHIEDYTFSALPKANSPNDYGDYKGSASNHGFVIENVIQTLNGKAEVKTSAEDGMMVVDIINRMYESGNRNDILDELKSLKNPIKS